MSYWACAGSYWLVLARIGSHSLELRRIAFCSIVFGPYWRRIGSYWRRIGSYLARIGSYWYVLVRIWLV
jgi:hypothetical protein